LIIYNTSMDKLQYYTGSDWANIGSGEEINPSTPLLVGWGRNDTVGAVGNNSTANELYMVSVASPPSNIVRGSGGGYFHGTQGITCLVTSSNQLYCWGRGEGIGDGDATDEFYPKLSGAAYSWNDVSVGSSLSSCGITTANLAYCWGYQQYNALGNGVNSGAYLYTPQGPVGTSAFTWKQLAVGGLYNGSNHVAHVCGIRLTDNRAYCWGNDAYEQLGNGAGGVNNYTATPTVISDTRAWLMLTAGGYHTCGIDTGDDAYCWGQGTNGQLGNNGIAASGVIVAVSGGRSWSSITAGRYHTCGIEKTTQKAFCWGDNGNGQLGTGNVTDSVVPVAVLGAKKWKKLVAGREHTCGIDSTDRIFCWGIGTSGQIGDGDNTDKLVPTLVWGDYTFSDLWLSSDATIALTK
jgi:alpha-tubulin suppressor-like RCC1 family protein